MFFVIGGFGTDQPDSSGSAGIRLSQSRTPGDNFRELGRLRI
ncbi:hypothetical protein [Sinorhizobium medicae]|nr:hypothetical protein [Sinorhizobium medicae]TWA45350.1 hypothetical protein FB008_13122 [Sinorhizobium medicae]WQP40179.1 hypothetical protein U8C38_24520 [Sinorhizobium medicae]